MASRQAQTGGRGRGASDLTHRLTQTLRRRRKPQGPDYSAVDRCVKYFLFIINFIFLVSHGNNVHRFRTGKTALVVHEQIGL